MLRSARLLLRDFHDNDIARVFEYQTLPAYLKYYDGATPTYEDARRLVSLFVKWAQVIPRTNYQLAITLDSYLIGTCGVREQQAHVAEFGCELDPTFWGHGYAHEASATLLAFVRRTLPVETVLARTRPDNVAAIRLAENLGFAMIELGLFALKIKGSSTLSLATHP